MKNIFVCNIDYYFILLTKTNHTNMSVNKVILLGNVGQDPRVKYFDSGSAVATFSLATTERGYTLANGTKIPDRTEWHNIVASNRLAEVVDKYVKKGDKLYLEGKIRSRSYLEQNGATRYITEVYVDVMEMLTPKATNNNQAETNIQQTTQTKTETATSNNKMEDDLPF